VFNNPLKYVDPTGYEGGPFGPPQDYAYGVGSASPGMGFYGFNYLPWGQTRFSNSGFALPGSGNHWSDQNRSEYGNFMLMSSSSFDSYYGAGSFKMVQAISTNPVLFKEWKGSDWTLDDLREGRVDHPDIVRGGGGFYVRSTRINPVVFDTGDGSEQLNEVEIINTWVAVCQDGGGDIYDCANLALNGINTLSYTINIRQIPDLRQIDALGTKFSKGVNSASRGLTRIGVGISVTSGILSIYRYSMIENPTWGDRTELGIGITSAILSSIPYTTYVGIGIGLVDIAGGFDGFYNFMDMNESLYNSSGTVIMPNINGIFVPVRLK
jgi:hypothetical protein